MILDQNNSILIYTCNLPLWEGTTVGGNNNLNSQSISTTDKLEASRLIANKGIVDQVVTIDALTKATKVNVVEATHDLTTIGTNNAVSKISSFSVTSSKVVGCTGTCHISTILYISFR